MGETRSRRTRNALWDFCRNNNSGGRPCAIREAIKYSTPSILYLILSYPTRQEHNLGVYPYVFGGELFDGIIADKIYRAVLPEIKMADVKTEISSCSSVHTADVEKKSK